MALYPDYNYCDTKWKAIDIYALEGWENIEVGGEFQSSMKDRIFRSVKVLENFSGSSGAGRYTE